MDLEKLYDLTERENIKIYDFYFDEDINGMYLNYDKLNTIALNYKNLENTAQEKCVLAEELGHYYMNATYNYCNVDCIEYRRQEYRATKWSYYVLVPFDKLKSAIIKRIQYSL